MAIDARSDLAAVFVLPEGRLDSNSSAKFHEELESATDSGGRVVVIDMEAVDYVSSAGLRVIMQAVRRMQQQGGSLALCALTKDVRAVFETSGFDQLIQIHPSRTDAVAALAGQG